MKHQDIVEGSYLKLKPEAEARYALSGRFQVWFLKFKPGYKTPFVAVKTEGGSTLLYFKPSDFAGVA